MTNKTNCERGSTVVVGQRAIEQVLLQAQVAEARKGHLQAEGGQGTNEVVVIEDERGERAEAAPRRWDRAQEADRRQVECHPHALAVDEARDADPVTKDGTYAQRCR